MVNLGFSSMDFLFALFVLGMGYIVLSMADKTGAAFQKTGRIIGKTMIIVSAVFIVIYLYVLTVLITRMATTGSRRQETQQGRMVNPGQQAPPRGPVR